MLTRETSLSEARTPLTEALVVYIGFCALSISSRFLQPLFLAAMLFGIAFPVIWAKQTRDWASIGLTRRDSRQALLWGIGAGLLISSYIFLSAENSVKTSSAPLALQLAVGLPITFLVVSPSQEFLFRGWPQPRFQYAMGKWAGLTATSLAFAFWHLCPPFEGSPTSTLQVAWPSGILVTLLLGLAWGYVHQRTGNLIAPWLSHGLAAITLILTGNMTLVVYR